MIAWRVVQGFSGGTLIPAVFSAVFLLFPVRQQGAATTLGGVLAVLAPTVGPIVGGWITQTYSWQWLFLINVLPGILSAILASLLLPRSLVQASEARKLDVVSLLLMTIALACLVLALKEAPQRGWTSGMILGLLLVSLSSAAAFVGRTRKAPYPLVDLGNFADRSFAIGCILSFALGIGLFGSVYLMPVFLAFVRDHNALEIGSIMLVTGVVQLLVAPVAVALEQRADARLLTAAGFAMFALGLGLSAFQTPQTDYDGMFWPQVIRGLAIMFCLLPPTRLALGALDASRVPDASGVFNLMRNLGGAIGLALIDTVIFSRTPHHGAAILDRLSAGDMATASMVGASLELFAARPPGPLDATMRDLLQPLIEKASLTQAINEAWALIALLTIAALICVPLAKVVLASTSTNSSLILAGCCQTIKSLSPPCLACIRATYLKHRKMRVSGMDPRPAGVSLPKPTFLRQRSIGAQSLVSSRFRVSVIASRSRGYASSASNLESRRSGLCAKPAWSTIR